MVHTLAEKAARGACRAYLRPSVTGLEHVPRTGPAIFAANHLSAADEVVTPIAAHREIAYLAKAEYFTQPGLKGRARGWLMREFGHVPVDRDNARAAAATVRIGLDLLASGRGLGIYPEGTRSPDGRLYRFRTGVARLALGSGAPVIPVGLIGTDGVLRPGDTRWHRAPVVVHFGPPLDFSGHAEDQHSSVRLREVTETVREAVQHLSGQDYLDLYASAVKRSE